MVKTEWECDDCGAHFNSRAARLYHRNHNCPAIKAKEELTEGKVEVHEIPIGETPSEAGQESTKGNQQSETESEKSVFTEGTVVERNLIVTEETPEDEGEMGLLIVLIIIPVLLCAGILIFREKIIAFIRRE